MNWTFISEYAHGNAYNSYPDPFLGEQSDQVFDLYTVEHMLDFTDQLMSYSKIKNTDMIAWETIFGIVMLAASMAINGGHF